ncbi:MAG: hypothetical protein O9346_13640, partial [Leptospiraceae bacterium]|nr:hypothetical protein [Leptospiraceae bacterium]MCZ8347452.1 hypothetical protein [Leptospiraceae bacterium]
IHSPLDDLFGALGTIGGGLIGSLGLAFGRKREDEITGEATVRDGKVDGETSQSNILNGLTLSSISVAEQNTKGEKETPKKTLVLSPENQKIQDLEAEVQKRRDELDKTTRLTSPFSVNQKSYSRTYTLAEAKLNDSIKALEKAKKQQTDRILKTSDGKKLSFELSNARYVMDDILKSNEFKTQTDAMNQSLVAKNVLENTIKDLKKENRPAAEIKIHQDALDRTKDSISKAQASLDSMTKKALKDVDNAKAKLDNFINKERVKENQVIKDIEKAKKDSDALNKYKATDFGVTQAQFDKKYILIEKSGLLKAEDKSMLKSLSSEINEMNKLKTELKFPDILIKDGARIREILSNPNTLPEVKQYLVKLESILASTGDSIERQLQLDKLKKDNLLKTIDKSLDGRINQLRAESNAVLNHVVIRDNQKYNQDELSKLTATKELKEKFNKEASLQLYVDTHLTSRVDLANERIAKSSERAQVEKDLKAATGNEKKVLMAKLLEINQRIETLDKNVQSFRMGAKIGESPESYVIRMKESFVGETIALNNIIADLNYRIESENNPKLKESLKLKLNDFSIKLLEVENQAARAKAYEENSIYVRHEDADGKKIPYDLPVKDGVFSSPISEATITLNSHFGADGYGTSLQEIDKHIYGDEHKGVDVTGKLREPVMSMLPGKVTSITFGVSTEMINSKALRVAGITYDKVSGNYLNKEGKIMITEDVKKVLVEGKETSFNVDKPTFREMGIQKDPKTGDYFVINSSSNADRVVLTKAQVKNLNLPPGKEISPNGNSLTIASTIKSGEFAGTYSISYKHFDSLPAGIESNVYQDKTTKYPSVYKVDNVTFEPGDTIGTLGGTGRSTGPHLHIEVTSTSPSIPDKVPRQYYDVLSLDKYGKANSFRINPAYFMKEMAGKQ